MTQVTRTDLTYLSTKTYTHAQGFSCCFRQHKATSHCRLLHGYSLQIKLTFSSQLDENNWVQDFGGLKVVKEYLEGMFDHTLLLAEDDPQAGLIEALHRADVARIVYVTATGCEKFAEMILDHIDMFHKHISAKLIAVEVSEHAGNSATVVRKQIPEIYVIEQNTLHDGINDQKEHSA